MLGLDDVIRIAISFDLPYSTVAYMVLHYLATSGTGADPVTVVTNISNSVLGTMEVNDGPFTNFMLSVEADLFKYDFINGRFDGLASIPNVTFDGGTAGQYMPNQTAALIKLFTNVARRQGRKYMPGMTEAGIDNGQLAPGILTDLGNIADLLSDAIVSDGVTFTPGVFGQDDTSPLYETFAQFIDAYALATDTSTQRKRKPGVGI